MSIGIIFVVVFMFVLIRLIFRDPPNSGHTGKYRHKENSNDSFAAGSTPDLFDAHSTVDPHSHHSNHTHHHSGHDSGHSWGGDSGHSGGSDSGGGGSDGGGGGGGD